MIQKTDLWGIEAGFRSIF